MFVNHIITSIRELTTNKGRSMLTMLGIIIGIGSVIFIMTLGEAAKNFLLSQLTRFGTNVVEISTRESFGFQEGQNVQLTEDDVRTLYDSHLLPEITGISAGFTTIESFEYEGKKLNASVFGDRPEFFSVNNIRLMKGRLFNTADVRNKSRVVVLGEDMAQDFFGHTDVIGKKVKLGGNAFRVIGLIEDISFGPGNIIPNRIYAPISSVKQLFGSSEDQQNVSYLLVEFKSGTNIASFEKRLDYELRKNHHLLNEENVFLIMSRQQFLDIFNTILLGIQFFVSAVAAISLLVGGIGIMNIMLVIVKERTKEIGLRKAIGAKNSSILLQFLLEAVALTMTGGLIGISIGLFGSYGALRIVSLAEPSLAVPFVIVPQAIVLAFGVASAVGLIFGLYPAMKASKLHPIEALRYE